MLSPLEACQDVIDVFVAVVSFGDRTGACCLLRKDGEIFSLG